MQRFLLLVFACVASCHGSCGLDLERMIDQPYFRSYEACEQCPAGTIMLEPPRGTVARETLVAPDRIARGRTGGAYVEDIPVALDEQVLARGKSRFEIYCAACHGRLGNGLSQVAENMKLRRPPNLVGPPYLGYPPGRLFTVISEGYGFMRSYAPELTIADRWAVVAYLQALQLSQHVTLDELSAARREEARPWLE